MAVALPVFALALFAPGYVVGWVSDLFHFRRMSWAHRAMWAVVYSFALSPVLLYWTGKYVSLTAACCVLLTMAVAAAALILRERPPIRWHSVAAVVTAGLLFAAFVFLMLADFQVGHKLYFSVVEFDQSYRVAFTQPVLQSGVPPANPLYFAGAPQPMRYYYFWYIVCAAIAKLTDVSARQAFFASSVWAGVGLAAITALFVRHFGEQSGNAKRKASIAVALLAVTGADLLPALGSNFSEPAIHGDMEWWSVDQFSSWQDSILWVPHHTAALVACLVALLVVWKTYKERRQYVAAALIAGAACASAFGLSVYLAAGLAMLCAAWLLRLLTRREKLSPWLATMGLTSVVALLLLAPLLREFVSGSVSQSSGNAGHVLAFGLRSMVDPEILIGLPPFHWFRHRDALPLAKLTLMPLGLALELGFYALTLWIAIRARRKGALPPSPGRDLAIFLSLCGLVMVCCVRSTVIGNNDFGYRAAMLPQFLLLLPAADAIAEWWSNPTVMTILRKRLAVSLIALGLAGTVYQAVMLRAYLSIEEHTAGSGFAGLPERMYEAREALTALQADTPANAVWQFNPFDTAAATTHHVVPPYIYYNRGLLMYGGRQVLNAEESCAAQFGGDVRPCAYILSETKKMYALPARTLEEAQAYCGRFGVSYLAAGDRDPVWTDRASWVWTLPALSVQPTFRLIRCSR